MLRLQLLQCFQAPALLLLHGVRSAAFGAVHFITFVSNLCLHEIHELACTCLTAEASHQMCRFVQFSPQKWHSPSSFKTATALLSLCELSKECVKVWFLTLSRRVESASCLSQEST